MLVRLQAVSTVQPLLQWRETGIIFKGRSVGGLRGLESQLSDDDSQVVPSPLTPRAKAMRRHLNPNLKHHCANHYLSTSFNSPFTTSQHIPAIHCDVSPPVMHATLATLRDSNELPPAIARQGLTRHSHSIPVTMLPRLSNLFRTHFSHTNFRALSQSCVP
jgi:hypothetical protein